MTAPPSPPKPMEAKMSDQNNAPELPARIWAWSEDDDFLRAKPHGVMHGTEYIRADRAAPEGQVRAKIEGLIEDAIANAEVDYPAGREAGHSITWDSDRLLDDIIAALTPPPAAPTDNTALVEALKDPPMVKHAIGRDTPDEDAWRELMVKAAAALASREAPPACQQEAVTEEMGGGDVIALVDPSDWDVEPQLAYARGWNAALRALKGERG